VSEGTHILVVDDDARLRALLSRYLGEHGFRVTMADGAAEARSTLRFVAPDLIVLDVMMPGESGLALAEELRRTANEVPILMLTARGTPEDRIAGFEAGADDYLPKPFEPLELVLRIRALLRRSAPPPPPAGPVRVGALTFYPERGELRGADGPIRLTAGEAALLGALARRAHEVLSREDIASVLGMDDASERAVDVQVTRLRRKIEPDPREPRFLLTVRGRGYVMKPGPD
jgi:two-component system, OmpR family, phosphate regulon response regulator OmpR